MLTPADKHEAFLATALTLFRVAFQGGSAKVTVPNAGTGKPDTLYFDQASAAAFVHDLIDDFATKALSDPSLALADRQAINQWISNQPQHSTKN